jgi:hypothetical protein
MLVIICALGALISSLIALGKNRNPIGWLVVGALIPLISVIILLALEPVPVHGQRPENGRA